MRIVQPTRTGDSADVSHGGTTHPLRSTARRARDDEAQRHDWRSDAGRVASRDLRRAGQRRRAGPAQRGQAERTPSPTPPPGPRPES